MPTSLTRTNQVLRLLIAVVSLLVVLCFFVAALARFRYPYELEALEGYMFLAALRVFHGQTVYPAPSLDFVPYMYVPGYYYACAALGRVMGMTIATTRMVSILSTLGCFGMIYLLVWKEVKRFLPAIAAVGIYAGCYTLTQEWFDLGRLDSLFIFLILLALYATRFLHPVLAAILWALAFQTKQSVLPCAFVMLCWNWRDVKRTVLGLVTLALAAGGSAAYLNHISQGWYRFYAFRVPAANANLKLRTALIFWPVDVLRSLALAVAVVVVAVLVTRPSLRSRVTHFYLAACSLVPLFWWIRTHDGSTVNALMPVYMLLAVLFGLSFARLSAWSGSLEPRHAQTAAAVLLSAVLVQEASGVFDPVDYRRSKASAASMDALIDGLKSIPGTVYLPRHPYYEYLAGKPTQADLVSLSDAMQAATPAVQASLKQDIQSPLDRHRYTAIFFDDESDESRFDALLAARPDWRAYYALQKPIIGLQSVSGALWPREHCAAEPVRTDCFPMPGTR